VPNASHALIAVRVEHIEKNTLHSQLRSSLKGLLLLAILSLFWGLGWPAMKITLAEVRPWTFRAVCLMTSGSALLLLARSGGYRLRVPPEDLWPLILTSIINITGWHILSAHGVAAMQAGRAAIVAYTMPLWAVILSRLLLKEEVTAPRLWALAVGFAGLVLLLGPDVQKIGAAPAGVIFMLGAAFCWAAGTVLIKFFRWHMPAALVMGWQLLIGGIPVVIGALLLDPPAALGGISWKAAAAFVYLIAGPMIFCHWAFFVVVQMFPANVAALSTLIIPVIGVFSSALLLGEALSLYELTALCLVVVALALTSLGKRP
jgi:drug/metabolite transporter (DMT)-like permease